MNKTIAFVWTWASILSDGIDDCRHAFDETCRGGLAAVDAFSWYYSAESDVATLIIPRLDFQTPFAQMNPLGWNINRIVMKNYFGWEVFLAEPSHLYGKSGNLDYMRSYGYQPLLSNVHTAYENEWNGFVQDIYFHEPSGLAILHVYDPSQVLIVKSTGSSVFDRVKRLLLNIELRNREEGCVPFEAPFQKFVDATFSLTYRVSNAADTQRCWIPVILYDNPDQEFFQQFLEDIINYKYPPSIVLNISGNNETFNQPSAIGPANTWIHSYKKDLGMVFHQQRIHIADDGRTIENITTIERDMSSLPMEIKDPKFIADASYLRALAEMAAEHNPVVGYSEEMPMTVDGNTWYCLGGECPMGNLYTDALRWYGKTDIGIVNCGGIRGPGWPAGPVRVSDLWEALPYANTYCEAHMSGLSLFRMFNHSTSAALFVAEFRSTADRLLQVSGMRFTYNTDLKPSRLLSMEIWNNETAQSESMERLRTYSIATNSFFCEAMTPFLAMLKTELILPGEKKPEISGVLVQDAVGSYLSSLETPYNTSIRGRLINDTTITVPMDWIQSPESCPVGTYWVLSFLSCMTCPATNVSFLDNTIQLAGQSFSEMTYSGETKLVNNNEFPLIVQFKSAPSWIEMEPHMTLQINLTANEALPVIIKALTALLEPGKLTESMTFSIADGGMFPGCVGNDATVSIQLTVDPAPELQKPGIASILWGLCLSGVAIVLSIGFAVWVFAHRDNRTVKALQPEFLQMLCMGVSTFCASIIPASLQDKLGSRGGSGGDISCVATVGLLSMGFMIIMTSLAIMTWRINRILGGSRGNGLRRVTATAKGACVHFSGPLILNVILLLLWALLDPIRWEIGHMPGDEWNQFGHCTGHGTFGMIIIGLSVGLNALVLLMAARLAYLTRNVSDEFSHSKPLAIAIFLGIQLSIVGLPVFFLIEDDNPEPQYLIQVLLTFSIGVLVLLVILVPIVQKQRKGPDGRRHPGAKISATGQTRVTGVEEITEAAASIACITSA